MPETQAEMYPEELVRDFANGLGSVFVGSGASVAAGLPDWATFLRQLTGKSLPTDLSHLDVAQHFKNEKEPLEFNERVWELLNTKNPPTPAHNVIVRLPVRRIFTTNLDTLLEKAALGTDRTPRTFTNMDTSFTIKNPRDLCIFKLHGDLDQRLSYVITADDYEGYAAKFPLCVLMMSYEFHTGTVLFVGYSFNDFDLRMILKEVSTQAGPLPRIHYALMINPPPAITKDLGRRHIKVIPILCQVSPDPHINVTTYSAAVHTWLEDFLIRVNRFNQATQSSSQEEGASTKPTVAGVSFLPPGPSYTSFIDLVENVSKVRHELSKSNICAVAIEGFPGSGKSSLALEVVRREIDGNSETRIVWIGGGNPKQRHSVADMVTAVSLMIKGVRPAEDEVEAAKEVARLLKSERVLLVIDNCDLDAQKDHDLVHWLNEIPRPSRLLITARRFPEGLFPHSSTVHLSGFGEDAARLFLAANAEDVISKEPLAVTGLIGATGGNPQALLLAVGLARNEKMTLSDVVDQLRGTMQLQPILDEKLFQQLFSSSWQLLDEDAKSVLLSIPLFSALPSINKLALTAASGVPEPSFNSALQHLIGANLLEETIAGSITVHPLVRAFTQIEQDRLSPARNVAMRSRELSFYLEFIRQYVVRKRALELPFYWNALVNSSMEHIDPEWPAIKEAVEWAVAKKRWDDVIEFVMLAVHYMDSRFLNQERLKYVHLAIEELNRAGKKREEALLRIDALGWTYIEEGRSSEAKTEIDAGFAIAKSLNDEDLKALAYSWLARIATAAGDVPNAAGLIQGALGMKTSQWIWYRVNMAAGDIAYSEDECERALQFYQTAEKRVMEYGGEEGYQIETRLGLAWVGLGKLDEAEQTFNHIGGLSQIAIGQLHAKYGLALVAKKRGDIVKAQKLADEVRQTLVSRTKSSLLLTMIDRLFS